MDGTNGLTFDEGALQRLRIRVLQGIEVDVFYGGDADPNEKRTAGD